MSQDTPPRFAVRVDTALRPVIESLTSAPEATFDDVFGKTPYFVITCFSFTEFKLNLMTEEEMLDEYKNDSDLQILTVEQE